MQIIKAMNYGARTVITVCLNPDAPEWVHTVGDQWRGSDGTFIFDDDGTPRLIVSASVPTGETGELCHNCHYNWILREVVFDGVEYGEKSADELWKLVCVACQPAMLPQDIAGLVGRSD